MKSSLTFPIAISMLALISVGCGSSEAKKEPVRTTTTKTYDNSGNVYSRRANEPLYEAPVTNVRAVVGDDEQRCWVEKEGASGTSGASVGGAIAGAVVGGILGHQIGSGRGQDVATAGGAIAGGAIGAKAGQKYATRDVKRCETVADTSPNYWDVTYEFRGVTHHVQMTNPPGKTVMVNAEGEPRV